MVLTTLAFVAQCASPLVVRSARTNGIRRKRTTRLIVIIFAFILSLSTWQKESNDVAFLASLCLYVYIYIYGKRFPVA